MRRSSVGQASVSISLATDSTMSTPQKRKYEDVDSGMFDDFHFEDKFHPWKNVKSLEEFRFYCCPECPSKHVNKTDFIKHAVTEHQSIIEVLDVVNREVHTLEKDHQMTKKAVMSSKESSPSRPRSSTPEPLRKKAKNAASNRIESDEEDEYEDDSDTEIQVLDVVNREVHPLEKDHQMTKKAVMSLEKSRPSRSRSPSPEPLRKKAKSSASNRIESDDENEYEDDTDDTEIQDLNSSPIDMVISNTFSLADEVPNAETVPPQAGMYAFDSCGSKKTTNPASSIKEKTPAKKTTREKAKATYYVGKYECISADNYDEFLKELGSTKICGKAEITTDKLKVRVHFLLAFYVVSFAFFTFR